MNEIINTNNPAIVELNILSIIPTPLSILYLYALPQLTLVIKGILENLHLSIITYCIIKGDSLFVLHLFGIDKDGFDLMILGIV